MIFISVLILFCSFHLKYIQNAPSHYQIDEFIVQLMTSEKFNELADIIAERAARKIKTVEDLNVTTLRHSSHLDRPRNKKDNKYKPTHARKDTLLRERKTDTENSGKFGKINTKAFLKDDLSSQELLLNYKHMTKELKRNKEQKKVKLQKDDNPERGRDDKFSDHSTEQFKDKTVNDKEKEWKNMKTKSRFEDNVTNKKHISSNNKHAYKRDEDSTSNKTITSKKLLKENDHSSLEGVEDRARDVDKKTKHSAEKHTMKSTTQTTKSVVDDSSSDSLNFESKKEITDHSDHTKETQEHKSRYSSKEVVEVGLNRALSDNDTSERHSDERIDLSESKEIHGTIQPIEKEQIVRRENGKLYTFLSSPDYNDYHESIAQIKSKNNYINTYRYK